MILIRAWYGYEKIEKLENIPPNLGNNITDKKRGERVRTIAGLPIGRVPRGLSSWFSRLLDSSDVECIECCVLL